MIEIRPGTSKGSLPARQLGIFVFALLVVFLCRFAMADAAVHRASSGYPAIPTGPSSFVHQPKAHVSSSKSSTKKKTSSSHSGPKLSHAEEVVRKDATDAERAFQAMQEAFYINGSGLYKGTPLYAYLWPFSQAFAVTVTLSNIPGQTTAFSSELQARLVGLQSYLDTSNSEEPEGTFTSTLPAFDGTVAPPRGSGGTKYYDDNEWTGIELVRTYELTGNTPALESAEQIMAFVMAGWQTTGVEGQALACPGGIPFDNAASNGERNTVTNAPAAELGVQLYRITGNVQYLQFAEMAYEWVRQCLMQPNLLYADHIGNRGVVEPTLWSYNQGTMMGAGVLLYQATGNSAYLYQARQTAGAALQYFTPSRLGSENPFFVAVYFRNLLYLDSVTGDPPGPSIAQTYVDFLASHHLASNGLFSTADYTPQLLVQAAIAQIYGLLSSSPSTYF